MKILREQQRDGKRRDGWSDDERATFVVERMQA